MKPILVCLIIFLFSVLELYTAKKVNLLSTSPKDVDNYWENYKLKFNRTHKNKTHEAFKYTKNPFLNFSKYFLNTFK